MFKKIAIYFSEPICTCQVQNLAWWVDLVDGRPSLGIRCKDCKTELKIPPDKVMAGFVFDRPYPGKTMLPPGEVVKNNATPAPETRVIEGCKIIPFDPNRNKR